MYNKVIESLKEIEKNEQVKILYAVESGSRAWGFPSPDSDYDVRFIYVRKPDFYLKLEKTRDVIELPPDKVFDINGWDIKKTLILLHLSNPTIFEWADSPTVYISTKKWEELKNIINCYFSKKTGLYHYISTVKNNYGKCFQSDEIKLKKYFYVIRPILACKWILDRGTPPPVLFDRLAESQLEENMKPIVKELLERKINADETEKVHPIKELNKYIETNLTEISDAISKLPKEKNQGYEELDKFFVSVLRDVQSV